MTINDIHLAMTYLATKRRAFWSEADFQFEFAEELRNIYPKADIRLERPFLNGVKSRNYIDIVVVSNGEIYPIELKYKTKATTITDYNNEIIDIRNHSAVDFGCYDYLQDISRLEQLRNQPNYGAGYALMLTNEETYYNNTGRLSAYDKFKIYEGAIRGAGELDWTRANFKYGNRVKFALKNSYIMKWHPYNNLCDNFKYIINEVK